MKFFLATISGLSLIHGFLEQHTVTQTVSWLVQSLTASKIMISGKDLSSTSTTGTLLTAVLQTIVAVRVLTYVVGHVVGFKAQHIPSLAGKRAIVTGANSGVGFHGALELAKAGAHVTLACRDPARGEAALKDLSQRVPGGKFDLLLVDLSDRKSVERAASEFQRKADKLDILINNAGIGAQGERGGSSNFFGSENGGVEFQMACNHLGHFLFVDLLKPLLEKGTEPRIVNVSSLAAWDADTADMGPSSLFTSPQAYLPMKQYNHSKLAQHWFSQEFARRNPQSKIRVVTCHPGASATNFISKTYMSSWLVIKAIMEHVIMQGSDAGAWPELLGATAPYASLAKDGTTVFAPMFGMAGPAVRGWVPTNANPKLTKQRQAEFWEASVTASKP